MARLRVGDRDLPSTAARDVTGAANDWAAAALATGTDRGEVEQRLDAWAAACDDAGAAPLRRVGQRLHPASRLRFR